MATPIGICPFSGKLQFASEQQAKRALRQAQRTVRRGRCPERIYDDCRCGFWHLTSQEQRWGRSGGRDRGGRRHLVGAPVPW